MIYMYEKVISGFSARLTLQELNEVTKKDGFIAAYPNHLHTRLTTHTPEFLGLNLQNGLWNSNGHGEGIIIGVLDGGVLPNHPSFSDEGIPKPPLKWKGRCDFNASLCNNKIIGARTFLDGITGMAPMDEDGHGTHTASTAAGNLVAGAEVLGNAKGIAVGMAPKAHLAIYKVCGLETCANADILAAMDAAISDGVDVLSISLGSFFQPFFENSIVVGAFSAIEQGVFVSCSAGNGGPTASVITNDAPWILTVAASTMDRRILVRVKLGNGIVIDGESVNQDHHILPVGFLPLVYAGASGKVNASFCGNGSLDGLDVKGKIVLCDRGGEIARIAKGETVRIAGGMGMILTNQVADAYSILADVHVLPASHVSYSDGLKIKEYINTSSKPTASISFLGTKLGTSPAPAIASFSSRGPSLASPGILKPDITGPGVNVLAAWPFPVILGNVSIASEFSFNIISGTSMSAPHLSGIAALIKSIHPDWSPAAIKSAIMTTADTMDRRGKPILDEQLLPANFFAVGSGHVNPRKAIDPGLVYDICPDDYIPYLCGLGFTNEQVGVITGRRIDCGSVKAIAEGELNYPSISVSFEDGRTSQTFERIVKNVGEVNSSYCVEVDAPSEVFIDVEPKELHFSETKQEIKFKITFSIYNVGNSTYSQGQLKWISDKRTVRSPIAIMFK
ncbi:Peptidase S8 subtilisin-related protein [Dioscorea alata]|uniref:Peptidase S8 subtilisin-related protein n=1 Tax=Dioscorea alata TaxID=55571 RepID=A0ACB7WRM0_DIOAL|nr:Peptidase S8 subtilisin-related protein [Dioscorea alata]